MARKNETEPISVKFLVMMTAMVLLMLVYATTPNQEKEVKRNKKSYKEMLEYNLPSNQNSRIKVTNKYADMTPENTSIPELNNGTYKYSQEKNTSSTLHSPKQAEKVQKTKKGSIEDYNKILDTVRKLPSKSVPSLQITLEKLLEYKGYPPQILKIVLTGSSPQSKIFIAAFDFSTGEIRISRDSVYSLNIEHIIPIIAHELDHFDNLAKMCKAMGIDNFKAFMENNGISNVNVDFWSVVSFYANTKNFDLEKFKSSIERQKIKNKINKISMYSTLYGIGENFRNPLEESAYAVSDYIYNYYGISQQEGSVELLIKKFNEVDWAIYNKISQNPLLSNERIALFDYYFTKAINKYYPEYKQLHEICLKRDNGDLSTYWKSLPFFKQGELTTKDTKKLYDLLSDVLIQTKYNLSDDEIANALYYRAKTLLSNITLPEDIKNIQNSASTYIRFINEKKLSQPKSELYMILTLLCIESKLYYGDENNLSLYYVKMPYVLKDIYKPLNKAVQYNFIYNNKEFQNIKNSRQNNIQDANLLVELLNENRLKHVNQNNFSYK